MQATIHNEFLTLTVDTHGAEAVSLKNAAGEEMLLQADPAIWKRSALMASSARSSSWMVSPSARSRVCSRSRAKPC